MKLRYFIPSLMAVVAAVFTGCSDDNDPTYLSEIRVSQSYVSLNTAGGSSTINITASADWNLEKIFAVTTKDADGNNVTTYYETPTWLTASQTSGAAGQSTLTLSAEAGVGRTAELVIACGGKTQRINVIQGIAEVSVATCLEVINGPDAKTYRVTGTVVSNPDNQYGNWYLEDETGRIYIYGTNDKKGGKGSYPVSGANGWGFGAGDKITVEGPKTTYNGTVELVDVTVLSFTKSLVKVEEGEENAFTADGGDFTVRLSVSGDGPFISIEDEAKSWLGVSSIVKTDTTVNVGFHVAPNPGEAARTATISFNSTSGSASSTVTVTVSQMGLSGTLTNPFSVEQAIAYCQTLSGASANDFYVKGTISRIANNGAFGSYGNATFFISDDGEFLGEDDRNPDKSHDFEAYRVLYFDNEKWTEGHANISVGDEVIICGKLTLYNGIAETASGNAYIYSINSVTTDANGVGSLAAPFTPAGAKAFIDNGGKNDVYVQGKVSQIANNGQFGAQYGNGTFWISTDGDYHDNDPELDFEAYRVLWLGNRKWQDGDDPIAVGDDVILHGQLTKYNTTYETSSGKAYIYSLNGKTE